jgi:hypothetical protein
MLFKKAFHKKRQRKLLFLTFVNKVCHVLGHLKKIGILDNKYSENLIQAYIYIYIYILYYGL